VARHIWGWYWQLAKTRPSNGMGGIMAIPYQEIDAWSRLSGNKLSSQDFEIITAMDAAFCEVAGTELAAIQEQEMQRNKG